MRAPQRSTVWLAVAIALAVAVDGGIFVKRRQLGGELARLAESRAADSTRLANANAARQRLALIRRRAEADGALHLAVAVDSGRMYLVRDGAVLRTMSVRVGVSRGVRAVTSVSADTVTLGDGTIISTDSASAADTGGGAPPPGVLVAHATDLDAILPDLVLGTKVYFYGQPESPGDTLPNTQSYIVVSINEHRLWYRQGDRTLYTTRVATGTGEALQKDSGGPVQWKFDTPRGRLVVHSKETDPVWVPPDWHYVEMARKKHLGTIKLKRGQTLSLGGGAKVLVDGNDVVTRFPDGHEEPFEVSEGKEIVVGHKVVIPPYGTNQRKYTGTLGVYRLYLGDGYGLHGTDEPTSIGRSASHGCVRLRNEDIETLYRLVPLGTVVYIY